VRPFCLAHPGQTGIGGSRERNHGTGQTYDSDRSCPGSPRIKRRQIRSDLSWVAGCGVLSRAFRRLRTGRCHRFEGRQRGTGSSEKRAVRSGGPGKAVRRQLQIEPPQMRSCCLQHRLPGSDDWKKTRRPKGLAVANEPRRFVSPRRFAPQSDRRPHRAVSFEAQGDLWRAFEPPVLPGCTAGGDEMARRSPIRRLSSTTDANLWLLTVGLAPEPPRVAACEVPNVSRVGAL